jgi:DNA (cytosine-5)-methyltransferase 1
VSLGAYYNEIDPYVAEWLERLCGKGLVTSGRVDRRSIRDVRAFDFRGFNQCHFFAGIGGWSYALKLAGWPQNLPVWTGSCPCQPFSVAGKRKGIDDERHLWPEWFRLIRECKPPVIFGEQVASPAGLAWFDIVSADLERAGYAIGAADLCAAGVGAPHIRQRLYFVAVSDRAGDEDARPRDVVAEASGMQGADGQRKRIRFDTGERDDPLRGPWAGSDWLPCRDGKRRPIEPGTFPLAHGIPNRVGRLRAYGNAIVPQVAATFVRAFTELMGITNERRPASVD